MFQPQAPALLEEPLPQQPQVPHNLGPMMQGLRIGGTPAGEDRSRRRAELSGSMAQSCGTQGTMGWRWTQETRGQPVPLCLCSASPGTFGVLLTSQLRRQSLPAWSQTLPLPFLLCAPSRLCDWAGPYTVCVCKVG